MIAPLDDDLEHLLFGDFPGFFIHSSYAGDTSWKGRT